MKTNGLSQVHFDLTPSLASAGVDNARQSKHFKILFLCLVLVCNPLWGQIQPQFRLGDRSSRVENSVFALVQIIVFNNDSITAELLGTAFLIDSGKVLTANHVISKSSFLNKFHQHDVLYFLLKRGNNFCHQITKNSIESYPQADLSIITLDTSISSCIPVEVLHLDEPEELRLVRSFGHQSGSNPIIAYHFFKNRFIIDKYDINHLKVDKIGHITASGEANFVRPGLSLNHIGILQVSFSGVPGVSGGPILYRGSGELLGIMSFKQDNTDLQYGIHVNEIIPLIRR